MILRKEAEPKHSNKSQVEIAILFLSNREASKVGGFVMACKLYVRMRMKEIIVEKQIQ